MRHRTNECDVLFLIYHPGLTLDNSAVFQSQVTDQALALGAMGYRVFVLCVYTDEVKFRKMVEEKLNENGIVVRKVRDRGIFINTLSCIFNVRNIMKNFSVKCVYVRDIWSALALNISTLSNRLSYVYDARGDIVDESSARGRSGLRLRVVEFLEKTCLQRARCVTAVTHRLADTLRRRARLDSPPVVIPSCINLTGFSFRGEQRANRRSELGYSKTDVVFIYSGGLSHYQKIPEMLALWRSIMDMHPNSRFLMLINSDPPSLQRSVGDLSDFGDRLKIMNLPRDEVFETLCAADVGFLLREERELNAAASPVKFAEYLSAGLSVVSSPGVGDLSQFIEEERVGLLVRAEKVECEKHAMIGFLAEFAKDRAGYQNRSLELARERYNWDAHRQSFEMLYGKPLGVS